MDCLEDITWRVAAMPPERRAALLALAVRRRPPPMAARCAHRWPVYTQPQLECVAPHCRTRVAVCRA